ncbi:MAG: dTDP-4-dehydrorhamnose reductase [Rariglobus sp.]|jgi:dTDP-4-dehydrorhamnose reductase|nr:dTDP-4-dehydrorhamnose reductase [Rariglobus sp.]
MIYLLGGNGYIGRAYQRLLAVRGIPHRSLSRAELDYADPALLAAALRAGRATFLINAAGYTGKPNVDACELHKAETLLGNSVLPGRIADACEAAGIPWGHVSSGCIYTGARPGGAGFNENDAPNFTFRQNNCSFYSGTKALGEEVLADRPDVFIWRLRIPFDRHDGPRNYLSKLMRYERLLDAANSLSELEEFAAATLSCWEKRIPFGTYNVTNPGHVTTREVAGLIHESGVCTREFTFFNDEAEFMRTVAKTPRSNCILDSSKLLATGIHLTPVHNALRKALQSWQRT